jgi:hypothetical protein
VNLTGLSQILKALRCHFVLAIRTCVLYVNSVKALVPVINARMVIT